MTSSEPGAAPKRSEVDPPAADRPVAEGPGSAPPKPAEPAEAAGRAANDPSIKEHGLVPEALQAPRGKPDGEVDTGSRSGSREGLFS